MDKSMENIAKLIMYTAIIHDKKQEEFEDEVKEVISMLNVLKENSCIVDPCVAKNFTIIKDCKKDSFDFVVDKAIACLSCYIDTDSVR